MYLVDVPELSTVRLILKKLYSLGVYLTYLSMQYLLFAAICALLLLTVALVHICTYVCHHESSEGCLSLTNPKALRNPTHSRST